MGAQSEDAIINRAEQTLGTGRVHSWHTLPAERRHRLAAAVSTADSNHPAVAAVIYPESQGELAEAMALAHQERWSILPLGSGSKLGWGGLCQPVQLGISTARLDRLIEHAAGDLTVTAEAGARISSLVPALQRQRQCFGFNPAYPEQATLGGVVATADTGWMGQRYGGIRDMLIGISLVRADGQLARAGGRVVKNVAGYDLMKLVTGAWGSLAVISEVTFRIFPQTEASKTLIAVGEATALETLLAQILKSGLTPTGLTLVNANAVDQLGYGQLGAGQQAGVLIRAQSVTVGVENQVTTMSKMADALGLETAIAVDEEEETVWQRLRSLLEQPPRAVTGNWVTAKVGLLPATGIATLQQLNAMADGAISVTHVGRGLGWIGLDLEEASQLIPIRQLYQSMGGFLSIMEAPAAWKSDLDIWGYSGSAMPLMRRIKQQFDPDHRLSPGRFVL